MSEVFGVTARLTIQNVIDVAVGNAFIAICAEFPPNCPAGRSGETAELTFWVGGRFADCHRNGTNAADVRENATACHLGCAAAADGREEAAENANTNAD